MARDLPWAGMDAAVVLGVAVVFGGVAAFAPAASCVTLSGACAVLLLARDRMPRALVVLAAVALGASAWRATRVVREHEASRAAIAETMPGPARCAGTAEVIESPVSMRGNLRWLARFEALGCEGASGRLLSLREPILATLYGGPPVLARGDRVAVIAQLARPQRFWNVETGDPRPAEARRRATLSGGVVDARPVKPGVGPGAWIDRARGRVRSRIEATFDPAVAPMARALVLGESDLNEDDDADFRASGLSHLLAVSGMHLVLVVAGLVKCAEALLVRVQAIAARIEAGRVVALAAVGGVWLYADFAGGGGSTVRAAWMMTTSLLARAAGRRSVAGRSFGLSLLAMGVGDPLVAHDVSFLLSAAATLGLIAFSEPIRAVLAQRMPAGPSVVARAGGWLAGATSTTLAATIPCSPVLARFAPTLPVGGVIANLLAVPLGETVALPICLVHAIVTPFPSAERGCALVAAGALGLVRAIAHAFAHARWLLVPVPPPTGFQLACLATGLLAWVVRAKRRTVIFSLLGVLSLGAELRARQPPRGVLRVSFLDVGQGDAAIVDLPDGSALLVDGGGLVGSPVDTGLRVIAPVLRARRRTALTAVVLSHPHPDHFTGLASGLDGVRIGSLWDTGQGEREGVGGAYAALLARVRAGGVHVSRPAELCGARAAGGAWVEVLAPCPYASSDRGPNDNSLVIRVTYGRRTVLFVGDAEAEEERDLLALGPGRLRADVLKVGHHGSRTSSGPRFVEAVSPSLAVISSGVRNRFGHPHPTTLRTLGAAGGRVYRTDREGEVTFWTDGERVVTRAAAERSFDLW